MKWMFLFLLLISITAHTESDQFQTNKLENYASLRAGDLVEPCDQAVRLYSGENLDNVEIFNAYICINFIYGFNAGYKVAKGPFHDLTERNNKNSSLFPTIPIYCVSDSVKTEQLIRIVNKRLGETTQYHKYAAGYFIGFVLTEEFPCK